MKLYFLIFAVAIATEVDEVTTNEPTNLLVTKMSKAVDRCK